VKKREQREEKKKEKKKRSTYFFGRLRRETRKVEKLKEANRNNEKGAEERGENQHSQKKGDLIERG